MTRLETITYDAIKSYDELHRQTIAPEALFAELREQYPAIPTEAWIRPAEQAYRRRGAEQMAEADALAREARSRP